MEVALLDLPLGKGNLAVEGICQRKANAALDVRLDQAGVDDRAGIDGYTTRLTAMRPFVISTSATAAT